MPPTEGAPKRESWRDWTPGAPEPSELWTRDELVARLQAADVAARPQDFLFWQRKGVVPYPVKKRQGTATTAYYAPWVAGLVRELRRLQAQGFNLAEIRPRLRVLARDLADRRDAMIQGGTATAAASAQGGRISDGTSIGGSTISIEARDPLQADMTETLSIVKMETAPPNFAVIAVVMASIYEQTYGTRIRAVEIRLIDERDNPLAFSFPITPPQE